MLKSYEATYEKGRLRWTQEKPEIKDGEKVIVVVDTLEPPKRRGQEIRRALQEARGAWGRGKTLEEIDREIAVRRAEDWPDDGAATR